MYALSIAACILFCLDTILNWTGNLLNKKPLADSSKPLLMPLLALTAILALIPAGAPKALLVVLVVALAFHTLGDIFLISEKEKHFLIGAGCFLIGHIFYLTIFGKAFASMQPWFFAVMVAVLVAVAVLLFLGMKKQGLALAIGVPVYAAVLLTLTFAGLAGVLGSYSSGSIFVLIGGILFVASDGMIALSGYVKKFPGYKFWIMFTYVIAEVLLVLGMAHPYMF